MDSQALSRIFVEHRQQPQLATALGPRPTMSDSEVLTMEVVGEFLGIDDEAALYRYFRRHWAAWFHHLRMVDRTTYTRQMANLWRMKEALWQAVLRQV